MTEQSRPTHESFSMEFDNPLNEVPILEFDENQRNEARREVEEISEELRDCNIGKDKAEESWAQAVEIVVTHGLFEYYSRIDELSKPKKFNRVINFIASKERDDTRSSLKRVGLRDLYWKHVIYPYIASRIVSDTVEEIDEYKLIFLEMSVIPSKEDGKKRVGLMYRLVKHYKESEPEEKERIRRFLEKRIADYPVDFKE